MSNAINIDDLRQRRQELQAVIAQESERADIKRREAEQHAANAATYLTRVDELELWIERFGSKHDSQNVIPMRRLAGQSERIKPSLRYRNPGATTDIVTLIYQAPGIKIEHITTTVFDKYKNQGTTRDTVGKMIRRLIREGFACRDGSKLFLTEKGKAAWESSPLYRAS